MALVGSQIITALVGSAKVQVANPECWPEAFAVGRRNERNAFLRVRAFFREDLLHGALA